LDQICSTIVYSASASSKTIR